jgi:catechol 2,3-dioxygenase-like lactoylglutathione lyase family enzyme
MPIVDLDHVAIPTDRPEELLRFYRALGFRGPTPEQWRERGSPFFSVSLGDTKINVHAPALWHDERFTLRGPTARPGCGDFCFVFEGTIDEAVALLTSAGAPVIEGPVERQGGRGNGRANGTSVYGRDPDGNLVELIVYP